MISKGSRKSHKASEQNLVGQDEDRLKYLKPPLVGLTNLGEGGVGACMYNYYKDWQYFF